jgi:hypothetical protein
MTEQMQGAPEDRLAFGRAARARIEDNFNMDAKADEWEALYRRTLKRHE